MPISDKQQEMLAFIENFVERNGYPPTHEEIRAGLKITTKSLVNYHLEALANAALLSRSPKTPRGIRLRNEADTRRVPLVGAVTTAPTAIHLDPADPSDVIELTADIVPNAADLYALRVQGEAMIDALVNDGDIVVLQPQAQAKNGEMVAVRLLERGEMTLKRYFRENGHVRLQPANPLLGPIIVNPDAVQVQGKVVAIIRRVV